jgi:hypothetical protein
MLNRYCDQYLVRLAFLVDQRTPCDRTEPGRTDLTQNETNLALRISTIV